MTRRITDPQRAPKIKNTAKISKKDPVVARKRVTTHTTNPKRKAREKGKGKGVSFRPTGASILLPKSGDSSRYDRETTPDRKTEIVEWDSPMKPRLGENPDVRSLYAEPIRDEIVKYIGGEVLLGSLEYFFKHILPPIRSVFDTDQIMNQCIKDGALRFKKHPKSYCWADFSTDVGRIKHHETEVYNQPFTNIFNAITDAVLKVVKSPKPTEKCDFHADGNIATWSLMDSDIKPDAHIFLKSKDDSYPKGLHGKHWYNVAFTFHFKKSTKSIDDGYQNIEQLLHSLHHCMAIDPCRRFTLGATIQGTQIRLWLYSRSTIICSDEFDFCSDPKIMIRLVLSLIYAGKDNLGWDSTINAKYDGHQRIFDFEIAGRLFRTSSTNVLSETKANGIYTSATRVYKAFCIDDKDEKAPVIIKDFWPVEKYDTEDIIRQMILDDIMDTSEKEIVRDFTLTPIASGRVKVGNCEDHTEQTILRGKSPSEIHKIILPNKKCGSKSSTSKGGFAGHRKEMDGQDRELTRKLEKNQRKTYEHRWHYRITYRECAIPYNKLHDLDDMFLVLVSVVEVLFIIHKAGWIHRDLSPNNLYLYTDPIGNKRGLVGDLEFAKKAGAASRCEVRTGSPDFTAVEIMNGSYSFQPRKKQGSEEIIKSFDKIFDFAEVNSVHADRVNRGVCANYLHDLESIWWIAVWTLFNFQTFSQSKSKSKDCKQKRKIQARISGELFPGDTSYLGRMNFLYDDTNFIKLIDDAPNGLTGLKTLVITIRTTLLMYYENEGNKENSEVGPILPTDNDPIHLAILALFNRLPRHVIKIVTTQQITQTENNNARSKRTTYDSRDDGEHPVKRRISSIENLTKADTNSFSALVEDTEEADTKGAEGMTLRSGLRRGQNISPNKGRGVINIMNTVGKEILETQRLKTRSMTKKYYLNI